MRVEFRSVRVLPVEARSRLLLTRGCAVEFVVVRLPELRVAVSVLLRFVLAETRSRLPLTRGGAVVFADVRFPLRRVAVSTLFRLVLVERRFPSLDTAARPSIVARPSRLIPTRLRSAELRSRISRASRPLSRLLNWLLDDVSLRRR